LLEAVARPAGRVVQVGHVFRFHPVTATLREPRRRAYRRSALRDRPLLGVQAAPDGTWASTQTDAIHYFDLFAHLFGRAATRVCALQRDFLGRGLDDLSVTIVHYGEVPAIVEASYFTPGTWRECVIVGERGTLVADYGTSTVTLHLGEHRKHGAAWEAVETGKEELPTPPRGASAARAPGLSSTRAPGRRGPIRFGLGRCARPRSGRSGRTGGSARLRRLASAPS